MGVLVWRESEAESFDYAMETASLLTTEIVGKLQDSVITTMKAWYKSHTGRDLDLNDFPGYVNSCLSRTEEEG